MGKRLHLEPPSRAIVAAGVVLLTSLPLGARATALLLDLPVHDPVASAESAASSSIGLNRQFDSLTAPSAGYAPGHSVTGFFSHLFNDYTTQLTFPVRYADAQPARFLLGFGCLSAMILTDHLTYDALVPQPPGENLVDAATTLTKWGNTRSALPLVLGVGVVGLIADSQREKDTSFMLAEALITSGTWTAILKEISGRERPRETESRISDWEGPSFLDSDDPQKFESFPSGHSTGIWAIATVLAHQYPSHGIVPIIGYGTATAMSYSRMVLGAHWLSDVVVGGLIGYGSARQVLSAHRQAPARAAEAKLHIGLNMTRDYKGIGVEYRF